MPLHKKDFFHLMQQFMYRSGPGPCIFGACYRRLFSSADPASTALRLKAFPDLKL